MTDDTERRDITPNFFSYVAIFWSACFSATKLGSLVLTVSVYINNPDSFLPSGTEGGAGIILGLLIALLVWAKLAIVTLAPSMLFGLAAVIAVLVARNRLQRAGWIGWYGASIAGCAIASAFVWIGFEEMLRQFRDGTMITPSILLENNLLGWAVGCVVAGFFAARRVRNTLEIEFPKPATPQGSSVSPPRRSRFRAADRPASSR